MKKELAQLIIMKIGEMFHLVMIIMLYKIQFGLMIKIVALFLLVFLIV